MDIESVDVRVFAINWIRQLLRVHSPEPPVHVVGLVEVHRTKIEIRPRVQLPLEFGVGEITQRQIRSPVLAEVDEFEAGLSLVFRPDVKVTFDRIVAE